MEIIDSKEIHPDNGDTYFIAAAMNDVFDGNDTKLVQIEEERPFDEGITARQATAYHVARLSLDHGRDYINDPTERSKLVKEIDPGLWKEQRAREHETSKLKREIEIDSLTGLGNRKAFDAAIGTANTDGSVSVIFVDADNFGQINKKLGDEVGDEAIVEIAHHLKKTASEFGFGERVFRKGGDEFVVLASSDVAADIKEQLIKAYGVRDFDGKVKVSLSAGIGNTFAEADEKLRSIKKLKQSQGFFGQAPAPEKII